MAKVLKVVLTSAFFTFPMGVMAEEKKAGSEVHGAKKTVSEYRALRRACTVYRHDEKRTCFKELIESEQGYRTAKDILMVSNASGSGY